MSVSNKAAGGVCWGALLCLPNPPHPVRVAEYAAMMCPLAKPTAFLLSLCLSSSCSFFIILLYISHKLYVHLLMSRYYIEESHSSTIWMSDHPFCDPLSPSFLLSDSERCWQLCYGFSLSELLSCLSFWDLIWWLTHTCYRHTLWDLYVCLKPKKEVCECVRLPGWFTEKTAWESVRLFANVWVSSCTHTPITWSCPDTSFEPKLLVTSQA